MTTTNRKSTNIAYVPFLTAIVLLTSLAIQPASASNEEVYKMISSDGSVEYTDSLVEGQVTSESQNIVPVRISKPILDTSIRPDGFSSDTLGGHHKRKANVSAVQITSLTNNQTLIDPPNSILITIEMAPYKRLPEGHTAEIRMNGEVVSNGRRTQSNVPTPDPGAHIFVARIINSNGAILVQSDPIKVHIE